MLGNAWERLRASGSVWDLERLVALGSGLELAGTIGVRSAWRRVALPGDPWRCQALPGASGAGWRSQAFPGAPAC